MIDTLVKTVLSELKEITQTKTVVGEPIRSGRVVIVPVSRISIGFGAGGGKQEGKTKEAKGTGGGVSIDPLAFLVIRENDVELLSIRKDGIGLGQVVEQLPEVFEKIKKWAGRKNAKSFGNKKAKK